MGEFVPVPDGELPAVYAAARDGRCVNCYREFDGDGFYCPDCDEPDDGEAE